MRGLLKGVLALCVLFAAATFGLLLFWLWIVGIALPNLDSGVALSAAKTIEASGGVAVHAGLPLFTVLAIAVAAVLCAVDDRGVAAILLGLAAVLQLAVLIVSMLLLPTSGAVDWVSFSSASLKQSLVTVMLSLVSLGLVAFGLWSAARSHFMRDA